MKKRILFITALVSALTTQAQTFFTEITGTPFTAVHYSTSTFFDSDGDGVGDLCDVCVDVPDPLQADVDADGQGDLCAPTALSLRPTGTVLLPEWDLFLECGAFDVDEVNIAVIPPENAVSPQFTLTCPVVPPGGQCASIDAINSTVSSLGLAVPVGVRDDAFYLHIEGDGANPICNALEVPSKIGELTTGGSNLAAASLSEEGIESPGFNLEIAETTFEPIPDFNIELAVGAAIPRARIELGPAIIDGGRTRWDVLLRDAGERFHRVSFSNQIGSLWGEYHPLTATDKEGQGEGIFKQGNMAADCWLGKFQCTSCA